MYPAYKSRYKHLDDIRYLGPPHERFPHMHPESRMSAMENPVYLEIKVLFGLGWRVFFMALAGGFFLGVLMLIIGGLITNGPIFDWFLIEVAGIALLFIFLTFLTRSDQPIRLYRPTQELIYTIRGKVHRIPWIQLPIRVIKSFQIRGAYSIYTLQFGLSVGTSQPMSFISVGGGERYEEEALRDWEYYCRYMEKGYVGLHKTMEREKTRERKYWEEFWESPFIKTVGLITVPAFWLMTKLSDKSFFKFKWPQEVIDMCENHPLLKQNGESG